MEEIKQVVWDIHQDGVAGPDGFSVAFYKECWETIKEDVFEAVLDFFNGGTFPRGMAATTLVLIQKVRGENLILKLDMAKVYDRVQWAFLLNVMKAFRFSNRFMDIIKRCIADCWFFVRINGTLSGFFQSKRGLRQGDPIFSFAIHYLSKIFIERFVSALQ
ncbi:hypothetical protein ZIOFF_032442 [Zingiber officinale]|uniref:Reverse transcriptase domain-containing protein n=1 Tax=Zingiber officinale TaxID=94328 RepID=A0A8J5GGS3_ZINOF|nr:hypothetical protein ZIOFF_032442 [Zingiber officinale]